MESAASSDSMVPQKGSQGEQDEVIWGYELNVVLIPTA
jgi:hypothetical protein